MTTVDSAIITPIENLLVQLPMGGSPMGRMMIGATLGGGVAYYLRPLVSFDEAGNPKPFILFDSDNPQAAVFPWWGFIVLPAVALGMFI